MSVIENDTNPLEKNIIHHKKPNGSHVAVVGCMAVSLGAAVVSGFKKSTTLHVVSALCFVGSALLHLFMHHRQLSYKVKTSLIEKKLWSDEVSYDEQL